MKEKEPTDSNPHSFDSRDIAALAATFLPPLPLGEDWESVPPEELQRRLATENLPGGSAAMSPVEDYGQQTELVLNPKAVGRPSVFEVLAEAAVQRARILMRIASGEKREERVAREREAEAENRRERADDDDASQALTEYQKKFGDREKVSLEEAAEVIFHKHRSKMIRDGLIQKWISLTDEELTKQGLYGAPTYYQEHGVEKLDYPDLKRNLLLCKELYYEAVKTEVSRKSGKKGGRKAQKQAREQQHLDPYTDPSRPPKTPRRGAD